MSDTVKSLPWTGQRFVPEVGENIALEHLHHYAMACELVQGKTVSDIACGEGYGAAMLAKFADQVTGVDISAETIAFANAKYQRTNLEFKIRSCGEIPIADASIDIIVSFKTIEHHNQHEAMMDEFKRVLHPGG